MLSKVLRIHLALKDYSKITEKEVNGRGLFERGLLSPFSSNNVYGYYDSYDYSYDADDLPNGPRFPSKRCHLDRIIDF
ncbi:MAG: hypothetical protein GWN00_00185 [Aliifodinibius sp.]|nr:hypothetical protein [Fodinibius sp.]NIY23284.1 hypothetical protein [Fodinibius sp.]